LTEGSDVPFVWINDAFVDEADASISVRDTGLLHGAGVFTTMRSFGGNVFRLAQHLQRLRRSCETLFIPLQRKDEQLAEAVHELLRRNELPEARLRITITRGTAQQDPLHGLHLQPNILITATELNPYPAEFYEKGLTVMVLDEQKLNPYDLQAGHKTLNYLSRLSALREATRRGAGEALWFNVHNYLQSGSISNVFLVKNDALITPPTPDEMRSVALPYPRSAVLPGITRQAVIELAKREQLQVEFAAIDINQLLDADEVLLSNSIMLVMPVTRVEGKAIGDDQPGPITRRMGEGLAELVRQETSG
jgi:branched-chain amino acid aminotransferase